MDSEFKIYIDRLKDGKVEKIDHAFLPDFLEVTETGLSFHKKVHVRGEVYLAEDELIFHLDLATTAQLPCTICNESVDVDVAVRGLYHVESLQKAKGAVFDMSRLLRESVLLETPSFAECGNGNCPKRGELGQYLKNDAPDESAVDAEGYRPFTNLTLEEGDCNHGRTEK